MVMSQPRRKLFGPLFYSTLLAAVLVSIFAGIQLGKPRVEEWLRRHRLVAAMHNPRARLAAMPDLAWEDDEFSVPLLAEAARDQDEDVRISACQCLVNKRAEPRLVMDLLADAVGSANEEVRYKAAWLLGRGSFQPDEGEATSTGSQLEEASATRKERFALLRRLVDDRSVKIRAAAISTLGEFGADPGAAAALAAAANDRDRGVRLAAATTILRINGPDDPTAATILCGLLANPEPSAIRQAALHVVRLTSRKTQEQAIKTLAGTISRADPIVLEQVVNCLSVAGPIARIALPSLDKLLDDDEPVTRAAAARAILRIEQSETPRVLAVMAELVAEKSLPQDWRIEALDMIKLRNPAALGKVSAGLIRQLGDPSADVRGTALALLSLIVPDTAAEMPGPAASR
jgi:HEAT repeat protein